MYPMYLGSLAAASVHSYIGTIWGFPSFLWSQWSSRRTRWRCWFFLVAHWHWNLVEVLNPIFTHWPSKFGFLGMQTCCSQRALCPSKDTLHWLRSSISPSRDTAGLVLGWASGLWDSKHTTYTHMYPDPFWNSIGYIAMGTSQRRSAPNW